LLEALLGGVLSAPVLRIVAEYAASGSLAVSAVERPVSCSSAQI
jgi:hypothetical protein